MRRLARTLMGLVLLIAIMTCALTRPALASTSTNVASPVVVGRAAHSATVLAGFQVASIDWSRWWDWAGHWVQIALGEINTISNSWKRSVVSQGLKMAISGASERVITYYYRSQGLYCPDRPWWLWLPDWLTPAWPVLTCAEHAGG